MTGASAADLALVAGRDGTTLRVHVKPKGKADLVSGVHGGALKLSVRAAPEEGKANTAVRRLLARALDAPLASIEILSGATSREKTVRVQGKDPAEVRRLLKAALAEAGE